MGLELVCVGCGRCVDLYGVSEFVNSLSVQVYIALASSQNLMGVLK